MSHLYAEDLVKMVANLAEVDFASQPSVKFLGALRRRLVISGFKPKDAETITSRIDVNIPPDALEQEHIDAIAESYCTIICKMRDALIDEGFTDPALAIVEAASKMTLKLS